MKSKFKSVNQYWAKHSRKLINKARKANDTPDLSRDIIHNFFVSNVDEYIKRGMDSQEAVAKVLRGREFTSEAMFYYQGVVDQLKSNEQYLKQLGYKEDKRGIGRFRNAKGQLTDDKFQTISYAGEVYIDGVLWKKYSIQAGNGKLLYYYETNSPKQSTYDNMLTEENYE